MDDFEERDDVLIRAMQCGDSSVRTRAWARWYQKDGPSLARYILKRCPLSCNCGEIQQCRWHSEDIFNEAFVIGFVNVSTGLYEDRGRPLIAYLIGIAGNLLRTAYRLDGRLAPPVSEMSENDAQKIETVEERIDLEEQVASIMAGIAKLKESRRMIILKRFFDSKSAAEVGEEMGMSPGRVRVETHRALKELRENSG